MNTEIWHHSPDDFGGSAFLHDNQFHVPFHSRAYCSMASLSAAEALSVALHGQTVQTNEHKVMP